MSNNNTDFEEGEDIDLEFEDYSEYKETVDEELFEIEAELRNEPY